MVCARTDGTREFDRLCGSKEAKAKLARTAAKVKDRARKRKERLKEQARVTREIPAEEPNVPGPRFVELDHQAEALEAGPPPPPRRQVCAYGACSCLSFFALRCGPQMMNSRSRCHTVSCTQPASKTVEVASHRPATGQSVHGIHLLAFLLASSPLELLPSRSLALHTRSKSASFC